jgi:hypothetical protein
MNLLKAIEESAKSTVEINGVTWHLRAVDSLLVAQSKVEGAGLLIAISPDSPEALRAQRAIEGIPDPEERELMRLQMMSSRLQAASTPARLASRIKHTQAIVCAGVVAVEASGEKQAVKMVAEQTDHNPDEGCLWIGYLSTDTQELLQAKILELSQKGGLSADALTRFRE